MPKHSFTFVCLFTHTHTNRPAHSENWHSDDFICACEKLSKKLWLMTAWLLWCMWHCAWNWQTWKGNCGLKIWTKPAYKSNLEFISNDEMMQTSFLLDSVLPFSNGNKNNNNKKTLSLTLITLSIALQFKMMFALGKCWVFNYAPLGSPSH